MKTSLWGNHGWKFLHAISFAYPDNPSEEHRQAALNLFQSLKYLLPCGECCGHYCSGLSKTNLEEVVKSRESLSRWLVDFHNSVNDRLGKPSYSYAQAEAEYTAEEAFCEAAARVGCNDDSKKKFISRPQSSPFPILILALSALVILSLLARKVKLV